MHPPLVSEKHPLCYAQAEALSKCHKDSGLVGKMLGRCNDHKAQLDRCLREEWKYKRKLRKSQGKVSQ